MLSGCSAFSFVQTNFLATIASVLSLAFLLAWNNEGRASGTWMVRSLYCLAVRRAGD